MVPVMCCDTVNRGLAYGDGKIFLQQADTTLVALDANTGKVVWTAKNGDPKIGETNTNAPHVFKDKVITGISGGEFGVRGRLIAYDIKTGKKVWTAWSTGPDCGDAGRSRQDDDLDERQDGAGRQGLVDQDLEGRPVEARRRHDLGLVLPTIRSSISSTTARGNPGTWNPAQRPGDNKWSMTIFARDLDTGMAKWVYQMTPHDEWDFDGVNEMTAGRHRLSRASKCPAVGALRPQRLRLHAESRDRRAAGGRKV